MTMFFKHVLSLIMHLRCLYDNLSGPGTDKLLQLVIVHMNSSSKKFDHTTKGNELSSLSTVSSISQNWTMLKEKWRACQRSSSSKQGWPLYLIILIARSLHLLTQFMSSQGPRLLLAISWILRSKNALFIVLTVFQNIFQLSMLFEDL